MKRILYLVSILFSLQNYSFSQEQVVIDLLEALLKVHNLEKIEMQIKSPSMYDTTAANILNQIAKIYNGNNIDMAIDYANQSLSLSEQLGYKTGIGNAYNNLGSIFLSKPDYLTSLEFYKKALKIREESGNKKGIAYSYYNIAYVYRQLDNIPDALKNYFASLKIREEIGDKDDIGGIFEPSRWLEVYNLHSLASLEIGRKNFNKAVLYLDTAYVQAKVLDLQELLQTNFELKAKLAEAMGNYKDALAFIKQSDVNKNTFEARSAGFDVRSFYLEKENYNLAMQKQLLTVQLDLQQKNLWYAYLLFFLALAVALLFVLGYFFQRNSKRLLAAQHDLIQVQNSQLKNLDEMKSKFFANVSHELRTPLTLILGPVNTLLKDVDLKVNQRKLLQAIRRSSNELKELVREILDLGKLEAGSMQLQLDATALSTFFSNYITQFYSMAEYKGIAFTLENKLEKNLIGTIDQVKCRQLIYNLLANAFKFTPSGGRIVVALAYKQKMLRIEVMDSGVGIHPMDLPSVFDRYFQSARPEKANKGGTGIGLALCKEYTLLFGGTIQVFSKLGEGTRFIVEFPVKLSASLDTESPIDRLLQPVVQEHSLRLNHTHAGLAATGLDDDKPQILVVEDNPNLQEYIQFLLTPQFSVILADNGQVALDQLATLHQQSRSCQLILSDLMMPVMDGQQLLERLKSDEATRHIPVIMLTAQAQAQDKLKALRIGVDDYLTKPFDEEELLARIDNLLLNQAVRRQAISSEAGTESNTNLLSLADQEWLVQFEAFVQKNLSSDILSIPALAVEFAMSESTLLRQLKRLIGLSPSQYLQEVRLDKARQLLEDRCYNTISEVAAAVGYADVRTLSRSFKQRFGKKPSEVMEE